MVKMLPIMLLLTAGSFFAGEQSPRSMLRRSTDSITASPVRESSSGLSSSQSTENNSPEQTPRSPESQGIKNAVSKKRIIVLNNGDSKELNYGSSPESDHKTFMALHSLLKQPHCRKNGEIQKILNKEDDLHPIGILAHLQQQGIATPGKAVIK
jgi:hypothetical protein